MQATLASVPGAPAPNTSAAAVLARAEHENFDVAPLLAGRANRAHLTAIYGFSRLVDTLGDEADGDRLAALGLLEADLDRVYSGTPEHPLMQRLAASVAALDLPRAPFARLIEANRVDQRDRDYESLDQLLAYCELSANPVGELVLHVFGFATPERIVLSDKVCTALQLVEHWQDIGEDARAGRVYLPRVDRERFGVDAEDLLADRTSPALRELVAFECTRVRALLDDGRALVPTLRGRARVAVAGYVGGGYAALDALAAAHYDVLPAGPKATKRARVRASLAALGGRR